MGNCQYRTCQSLRFIKFFPLIYQAYIVDIDIKQSKEEHFILLPQHGNTISEEAYSFSYVWCVMQKVLYMVHTNRLLHSNPVTFQFDYKQGHANLIA